MKTFIIALTIVSSSNVFADDNITAHNSEIVTQECVKAIENLKQVLKKKGDVVEAGEIVAEKCEA